MASPFENLLQAAQFAVQTRANYDQMAERRRENTMNLMQRRSELEQQNQQFLADMNLKDRQQRMQADQFNKSLNQQYNLARMQDIAATEERKLKARGLDITERGQEADIRYKTGMLGVSQGELGLRRDEFNLRKQQIERELAAQQAAREALLAGPVTTGADPGLDLAADYKNVPGKAGAVAAGITTGFLTGGLAGVPGGMISGMQLARSISPKGKVKELSAELLSEDLVKEASNVKQKINQAVFEGRPIDQNDIYYRYSQMYDAYQVAKGSMKQREKLRAEAAINDVFSLLPQDVQQRILTPQQ